MPLFNYLCEKCNNEFEEYVGSYNEKVMCPKCNGDLVKKTFPNRFSVSNNGTSNNSSPSTGFK